MHLSILLYLVFSLATEKAYKVKCEKQYNKIMYIKISIQIEKYYSLLIRFHTYDIITNNHLFPDVCSFKSNYSLDELFERYTFLLETVATSAYNFNQKLKKFQEYQKSETHFLQLEKFKKRLEVIDFSSCSKHLELCCNKILVGVFVDILYEYQTMSKISDLMKFTFGHNRQTPFTQINTGMKDLTTSKQNLKQNISKDKQIQMIIDSNDTLFEAIEFVCFSELESECIKYTTKKVNGSFKLELRPRLGLFYVKMLYLIFCNPYFFSDYDKFECFTDYVNKTSASYLIDLYVDMFFLENQKWYKDFLENTKKIEIIAVYSVEIYGKHRNAFFNIIHTLFIENQQEGEFIIQIIIKTLEKIEIACHILCQNLFTGNFEQVESEINELGGLVLERYENKFINHLKTKEKFILFDNYLEDYIVKVNKKLATVINSKSNFKIVSRSSQLYLICFNSTIYIS